MIGHATSGNKIAYGEFGLVATTPAWVTSNQIEAARVAMTKIHKARRAGMGKHIPPQTHHEEPAETRMGSGKGSPEYWVAVVKPDRVLFEMAGVSEETAREALRLAA